MKVLLLKDLAGLGKRGDLKEVNEGYGNNFLIKKGLALVATKEVQEKATRQLRDTQEKIRHSLDQAQRTAADFTKRTFTVKAKVGEGGKLFGAVREKDIAAVIGGKLGKEINKSSIIIKEQIRTLGEFPIEIKLTQGVTAHTKIKVEAL